MSPDSGPSRTWSSQSSPGWKQCGHLADPRTGLVLLLLISGNGDAESLETCHWGWGWEWGAKDASSGHSLWSRSLCAPLGCSLAGQCPIGRNGWGSHKQLGWGLGLVPSTETGLRDVPAFGLK